jgi:hypothetical protein
MRPRTPDEIRQEIAELERRRDLMLKNAPKHVFFARLIMPLILVPTVAGLGARLAVGRPAWVGVLVVLAVALVAGQACYKLWRPGYDPKDLWAASDRVGYEGESPRELQTRIDALEARLREDGASLT